MNSKLHISLKSDNKCTVQNFCLFLIEKQPISFAFQIVFQIPRINLIRVQKKLVNYQR